MHDATLYLPTVTATRQKLTCRLLLEGTKEQGRLKKRKRPFLVDAEGLGADQRLPSNLTRTAELSGYLVSRGVVGIRRAEKLSRDATRALTVHPPRVG